jgi:autotransporter strand-loop-strand O-heptosyltransferase
MDGAYVEIETSSSFKYPVKFINNVTGSEEFLTTLGNKTWAKTYSKYFKDWKIQILDQNSEVIEEINYNIAGKKVYISLDSKALGDNLAWFPYVEEFRKKHNCKVVCSTFWNNLFAEQYPEIELVAPGSSITGLYAMYKIGWYNNNEVFDSAMNPRDFKLGPLQRTAADILGLDYTEIKPLIKTYDRSTVTKKVGLGIHGTAQAKYWNNPNGWQEVTDWLLQNGYEPVIMSREHDGYMGNSHPIGAAKLPEGSIEEAVKNISECQAFIGISSGLTWLAWAANVPTIQVSGFTEPYNEPDNGIVKLAAPAGACSGCANRLRLDAGDWNWCPDHKGTSRQFECSKLITSEQVIAELKKILV